MRGGGFNRPARWGERRTRRRSRYENARLSALRDI